MRFTSLIKLRRPWVVLPGLAVLFALSLAGVKTGVEPRALAQSTDPAVVGQWSALQTWPAVAVHATLLPTGKVHFWAYSDGMRQWDPANNAVTSRANAGYNVFCNGHGLLANGKLFIAGGHIENGVGLPNASTYDPATNTWAHHPAMNAGRWYPTNTTLPNGDVLVTSGSIDNTVGANPLPQVWQVGSGSWRNLTNAQLSLPLYPWMHVAPDGRVFYTGSGRTTRFLNTAGTGSWTTGPNRVFGSRGYGTSVMYDNGKVLVVGGADPPTNSAEVIDLNAATPAWRNTNPMTIARRQLNATLMADGKVLVTGGSSAAGFNEPTGAVLYAEMWNPTNEAWTRLAGYQRYRGYHSTALLLPDGRVLSSGGDGQPNAEVFSPPYLFQGARPTTSSAPAAVAYGQTFFVGTPNATSISKITFIRLGSATHAFNMNQKLCYLSFTQASGGLNVTAPPNGNQAPPGHYLLFLVNNAGVPSLGRYVSISGAAPPAFSANINFQDSTSQGFTGFLADVGSVYGNRGNGHSYGWNASNTGNARNRNAANSPDERYDTLNHMQKPDNPNAFWEIAVPNGSYRVRLVSGDPSHFDGTYKINVEGVLTINATPTTTTRWFENTVTVTVSDGRLTVSNATGSVNNKVCFIEVTSN